MSLIQLNPVPSPVPIHTDDQRENLYKMETVGWTDINGQSERSRPAPFTVSWTAEGVRPPFTVSYGIAETAERKTLVTAETSVTLDNLVPDTAYVLTVSAEDATDSLSFTTANELPRCLRVDGVTNVRDVGGYKTEDGGRVRYHLVYRSGMLHDQSGVRLTDGGKKTLVDDFGIRVEIDFRGECAEQKDSVAGESVRYCVIPTVNEQKKSLSTQTTGICAFFKMLAERENYPVLVHCSAGTDRTGLCIFLLLSLLGVGETDLVRDYKFSNFAFLETGRDGGDIAGYYEVLSSYEGRTHAEKTRAYLLSIGVTDGELKQIVTILKENGK